MPSRSRGVETVTRLSTWGPRECSRCFEAADMDFTLERQAERRREKDTLCRSPRLAVDLEARIDDDDAIGDTCAAP